LRLRPLSLLMPWALALVTAGASAAEESLIADFEGSDYGDWAVVGEAFGSGPARGTLPNQMEVTGYEGQGLVNSYLGGDGSTGTLTSPEFEIDRPFLSFLVGGGMHPDQTCMDLLVGGEVVRSVTGPNDRPGGTERLEWATWDVRDLRGRRARLRIVDAHTGGGGHINVDQIVLRDEPRGPVITARELRLDKPYVVLGIPATGDRTCQMSLRIGGRVVRRYSCPAGSKANWVTWDVSALEGRAGLLAIVGPAADGEEALEIGLSDEPKGALMVVDKPYRETYRPQFHFTARENWLNDPNGLLFYAGEYHLFFQHNPEGREWGNMTWGHAVSSDLLSWRQLDHAIHPDELGTIFSGSGVVDAANTSGFATGNESPLVLIYTSAGEPFTQSIAYSNDKGRSWTKYAGNPVLGHIAGANRDPKVLWHAPSGKWVMALYLDANDYALFGSPDLKSWTKLCDVVVPGTSECPDFFELPVDGDPTNTRWVFWGANGRYRLGTFDGTAFVPETEPLPTDLGANFYAAQTWSDIPPEDGRRVQIAWMNGGEYPDMPFNQQMSIPCVLTLRTTRDGIRLFREPVAEVASLRTTTQWWQGTPIAPGEPLVPPIEAELLDVEAEIEVGDATRVTMSLRGEPVAYDAEARTLTALGRTAPLETEEGRIRLRILLDRTSLEGFANDGLVALSSCFLPDLADRTFRVEVEGGEARIVSLRVHTLRSVWPEVER